MLNESSIKSRRASCGLFDNTFSCGKDSSESGVVLEKKGRTADSFVSLDVKRLGSITRTTRPSGSMVAPPKNDCSNGFSGPSGLITISCRPNSSSTDNANDASAVRTITTGMVKSAFPGSRRRMWWRDCNSITCSSICKSLRSFSSRTEDGVGIVTSWMLSNGIAYFSVPTRTSNAVAMRRVRGRFKVNLVPTPGSDSTSICPFMPSMARFTTSSPTPRPAWSPTLSAVENPGMKINCRRSVSDIVCIWCDCASPILPALARIFSKSNPAPSSSTSMMTEFPRWAAWR